MKPDWKRILLGVSCIFLVYLFFVVSGVDYRVITYFESLPSEQAQRVGVSVVLLIMFLSSVVGFAFAKIKGRRPLTWGFVCFLLNVWAVIYLWSLPNLRNPKGSEADQFSGEN